MKNTFLAIIIALSSSLAASCGGDPSNRDAHDHTTDTTQTNVIKEDPSSTGTAYACPMHPEETGKQGDTCPKCGMDLEPVK